HQVRVVDRRQRREEQALGVLEVLVQDVGDVLGGEAHDRSIASARAWCWVLRAGCGAECLVLSAGCGAECLVLSAGCRADCLVRYVGPNFSSATDGASRHPTWHR